MYQKLIAEVAQLAPNHKLRLLAAYRALFSSDILPAADWQDLAAAFPYLHFEAGVLVAAFGLDRRSGPHQLRIGSSPRSTWCIWDAFFIAETLNAEAQIDTRDPISGTALRARRRRGVWQFDKDYWVSFPVGAECCRTGGLRAAFCRYVHLFAHKSHAQGYEPQRCCPYPAAVVVARAVAMAEAMTHRPPLNDRTMAVEQQARQC